MTEQSSTESPQFELTDLTDLIRRARRGLRRDVAPLAAALDEGGLLVPLAKPIDGVPIGEAVQPDSGEVKLVPHLLSSPDGETFVPLFSDADVLRSVGEFLEWTTDGEALEYCTLPARTALDLALQLIDGNTVLGAVINPSDECELLLQRHELGSLCQGQPLPLVGYVADIPHDPSEKVLVAELETPPAPEFIRAIEACIADHAGVTGYRIEQTFNAERDLEPHPTLTLETDEEFSVDRATLSSALFAALDGKIPEPGYIDVMFSTPAEVTS